MYNKSPYWIIYDAIEVKNIDVYLPADYYANPDQQYAVIYYLHGATQNQNPALSFANL